VAKPSQVNVPSLRAVGGGQGRRQRFARKQQPLLCSLPIRIPREAGLGDMQAGVWRLQLRLLHASGEQSPPLSRIREDVSGVA